MILFQMHVIQYIEVLSCMNQIDLKLQVANVNVERVLQIWKALKTSLTAKRPSIGEASTSHESKDLPNIDDSSACKLVEVLIQIPLCSRIRTWCTMLETVELLVKTGSGPQLAESNVFEKLADHGLELEEDKNDSPRASEEVVEKETEGRTSQGGSDLGSVEDDLEVNTKDRDCKRLKLRVCKLLFDELLKSGRAGPQKIDIFVKFLEFELKIISDRWVKFSKDDKDLSSKSGPAEGQKPPVLKGLPEDIKILPRVLQHPSFCGEDYMKHFTLATKLPSIDADAPEDHPVEHVEDLVLDIIHVKEICEALQLICQSKDEIVH
jgi:hypothetical protein